MKVFPDKYKALAQNRFDLEGFSILPIRYEDRLAIMKWRNEQIYHLRQHKPLTEIDQNRYFNTVVAALFEQDQPNQLLFSYLENGKCIGYGGLVHINWIDRHAEISFIMDTALEKEYFHKHWEIYLGLIEQVAFQELDLHKIYTYAFDLRPHLYEAIETVGFRREATLKEHCLFGQDYKDVIIHSKISRNVDIRKALSADVKITYQWANDEQTRKNSFSSAPISCDTHKEWWQNKMMSKNAVYFICEVDGQSAGLIRLDRRSDNENFIIGITIASEYRGQGFACKFLKLACEKVFVEHDSAIEAYIKQENISSIKVFERTGFQFVEEVVINDCVANKYQLMKNEK